VCGGKGKAVKPVTIQSLLTENAKANISSVEGFRFCTTPSCEVAYFRSETGEQFLRRDVRVRIGLKETKSPRPICYCFDHTVEDIAAEVVATGSSSIADAITEKCRQGLDRCPETNPQGSCCLGNVRKVVAEAQAKNPAFASTTSPLPSSREGGKWNAGILTSGGAVITAILSSACCWLPLLLIAFGASAAGVAGFFDAYRPHLLASTAILMAVGFYLVYFRKEECAPGSACAVPNRRLTRFNKAML
jgi:hypothetical protein